MNWLQQLKNVFSRQGLGNVLEDELYQAQMDLLKAESHAELYTALATVYRARVSRLGRKVSDQLPKQSLELTV